MVFGQVHYIKYYVNDLKKSNLFCDWFMNKLSYKKISEWNSGVSWMHSSGTYICFEDPNQFAVEIYGKIT